MAMMNEMEYRTIGSALAGGYRAAVYCRLSKDCLLYTSNGRYNPSIQLAFKIARYFNMSIEEIFIYEED